MLQQGGGHKPEQGLIEPLALVTLTTEDFA